MAENVYTVLEIDDSTVPDPPKQEVPVDQDPRVKQEEVEEAVRLKEKEVPVRFRF